MAFFEFEDRRAGAPIVFGKRDDEPLLGVITLEALGLCLDPLRRRVKPMRSKLLSLHGRRERVGGRIRFAYRIAVLAAAR